MTLIDDFRPLLPFFRFLAAWVFIVTLPLTVFSGLPILGIVELIVTGIGFIHCLTLGILGHKAKKRQRALGTPSVEEAAIPKHPIVVVCVDFFLAFCLLVVVAFQLFWYYYNTWGDSHYDGSVFMAHAYIGALAGAHLEIFFGAVTLHMRRQLRHGRRAATDFERRERRKDNTTVGELTVSNSRVLDPEASA